MISPASIRLHGSMFKKIRRLSFLRTWAFRISDFPSPSSLRPALAALATALAIGLAGCASAPPAVRTDPQVAAAARRGRQAFEAGRFEAAADHYQAALRQARLLDRRSEIGDSAVGLAASLAAVGRHEPARAALREALAEFEPDTPEQADALLMMARIAEQAGDTDEAMAWLDKVLALGLQRKDRARARSLAHLRRGALLCETGRIEPARAALDAARRAARRFDPPPLFRAEERMLDGALLLRERQPRRAAEQFDAAADLYRRTGRPAELARALARAAESLSAAREPAAAAERHLRAARSLFAQNRHADALRQTDAGFAAARAANSPELENRLRDLLAEIENTLKKEAA